MTPATDLILIRASRRMPRASLADWLDRPMTARQTNVLSIVIIIGIIAALAVAGP